MESLLFLALAQATQPAGGKEGSNLDQSTVFIALATIIAALLGAAVGALLTVYLQRTEGKLHARYVIELQMEAARQQRRWDDLENLVKSIREAKKAVQRLAAKSDLPPSELITHAVRGLRQISSFFDYTGNLETNLRLRPDEKEQCIELQRTLTQFLLALRLNGGNGDDPLYPETLEKIKVQVDSMATEVSLLLELRYHEKPEERVAAPAPNPGLNRTAPLGGAAG